MTAKQAINKLARIQKIDASEFKGLTVRQAILECDLDVKRWNCSLEVLATIYN